jgi:hypothetical protein
MNHYLQEASLSSNNTSISTPKRDHLIQSLLSMGANGYFPLFDAGWVSSSYSDQSPLSDSQRQDGLLILDRLTQHRGIDRKKTVILSLEKKQRELVVKLFLELVEQKIQKTSGVIQ